MGKLVKAKGLNYINGEWTKGGGKKFTSINPATNQDNYNGNFSNKSDIKHAVNSANTAYPKWAALSVNQRIKYLDKYAKIIKKNLDVLTNIIAHETGKPLWEAHAEAKTVYNKLHISIDAYNERCHIKHFKENSADAFIRFKPFGTAAIIGPFNFPAHLVNGHIIPALIAGNTIVLKPSNLTPFSSEFIVRCIDEAKFPPGVVNLVQGDGETAQNLLHENIQAVLFTGSFDTGVKINKQFAERPDIILALEMGGNNPLVVDKVKNLDAAVYQAILSAFITAGQRCTCARRLIIPDNKFGRDFLDRFVTVAKNLIIGKYDAVPEPFMGPVIRHSHALEHLKAQSKLLDIGGKPLMTMELLDKKLAFLSPGIIDMSKVSNPQDKEIFAPIVQIYKYDSFEHALEIANDTEYGLVAGLFSDNSKNFDRFFFNVKAGLINFNRPTTGSSSKLPFGGVGRSGNFRPSAYYATDYSAYPVSSLEQTSVTMPEKINPGIIT